MDQVLERILSSPFFGVLAVILLGVLVFALFKKLLKLIVVAVLLLAAFAGYLYYTGSGARQAVKTAVEKAKDAVK